MRSLLHFIRRSFARLVRGYPRRFRDDFGEEMETVFDDLITGSSQQGIFSLLVVWFREMIFLPSSILTEIWHEMEPREAIMDTGLQGSPEAHLPTRWTEAFLAGLPHLGFAALIGMINLSHDNLSGGLTGWFLILLVLGGFFLAIYFTWRRQWPAWGASWYGYIGLLVLFFAILPSQGWNPPISRVLNAVGSLLLLAVTLVTLRYWLSRRDPVEGLLLGLPVVVIYWFPITEFVHHPLREWLIFSLFLVCALASVLILRRNNTSQGVWILLGASALGGLPLAFARTYMNDIPAGHFEPASLYQVIRLFSAQFLAGGALALGPVLGWGVWRLGKMSGTVGRLGAGLLILGMVVNLFGLFSYWRWFDHLDYFDALGLPFLYKPGGAFSVFLIYAGLIGILIGGFCLGALNWSRSPLLGISLALSGLALPHLAMFSVYSGFHISMPGFPLVLNALSPAYKNSVFEIAIFLLLLIGWTISRLYREPQIPEGSE